MFFLTHSEQLIKVFKKLAHEITMDFNYLNISLKNITQDMKGPSDSSSILGMILCFTGQRKL